VHGCADLARLGHVTRARVTQIMNLLNLAPDIQEEILFLPRVEGERQTVSERQVRAVAREADWAEQRKVWAEVKERVGCEHVCHNVSDVTKSRCGRERGW
jgi:hypothetical protein